jgi:hypothetical protein
LSSASEDAFAARLRPRGSGADGEDGTFVPQIGQSVIPKDVQDVAQFEHFEIIVLVLHLGETLPHQWTKDPETGFMSLRILPPYIRGGPGGRGYRFGAFKVSPSMKGT